MKGDIAFVGFMLTADEWQELDAQSRAQLIAVATRQTGPWPEVDKPRRFPEGTGKHEIVESLDDELENLIELELLDADLLVPIDDTEAAVEVDLARIDQNGDVSLFADDQVTVDIAAQYDAIEEWLAFQPHHEHTDHDEWVTLPPAQLYVPVVKYEDFADWADL